MGIQRYRDNPHLRFAHMAAMEKQAKTAAVPPKATPISLRQVDRGSRYVATTIGSLADKCWYHREVLAQYSKEQEHTPVAALDSSESGGPVWSP